MNIAKIRSFFKIAAQKATCKHDNRTFFLGSVGIRNDGAHVFAVNSPSISPNRLIHSEYRLLKKCDVGSTIFVARVKADGSYGMARPCHNCSKFIVTKKVHKVYYTVNAEQYGVWSVENDVDRVYNLR
jgi:tRNA(Arg) A34 adenosine deaminase TadA